MNGFLFLLGAEGAPGKKIAHCLDLPIIFALISIKLVTGKLNATDRKMLPENVRRFMRFLLKKLLKKTRPLRSVFFA